MRYRSLLTSVLALLALAISATAALAASPRAVVYSKSTTVAGETKGGLFAVKAGHLNQLTEDPTDTEPAFSADGRTITFARGGDLYSVRPDGSGLRHLTSGATLDSAPVVSPDGKQVVFERRASEDTAADLYAVRVLGGGLHGLTSGPDDDHQADFSPDGRAIVFVRDSDPGPNATEDLYSVRPSGARLTRLTRTGVDEFKPRYFTGGIVYSRGESSEGPAAYADVYTMRRNGSKVKALVAGVGSAYVEDVSAGNVLLFRRDQGLWSKRIGPGRARKLAQLPDGSRTSGVFSSDGRKVAAFVAVEDQQSLVAIDVANRRQTQLAEGFEASEKDGTVIGPVIAWQPVPPKGS